MTIDGNNGYTYHPFDYGEGFESRTEANVVVGILEGDDIRHDFAGDDGGQVASDGEEWVKYFGLGHGRDIIRTLIDVG
jgi:hypothetical protein